MPPDPGQEQARNIAASAIRGMLGPKCPADPEVVAQTAIAAYVVARASQGFQDKEIQAALSSERPWDMVRLVEPGLQDRAVAQAVLPVAGEVASQIDPTGRKPFFEWSRDEILRLFEVVIWAWEESQGRINVAHGIVPPAHAASVSPPPPQPDQRSELVMAGVTLPASRYRGPIIDDEIPF